jgi:hypothetical protein
MKYRLLFPLKCQLNFLQNKKYNAIIRAYSIFKNKL